MTGAPPRRPLVVGNWKMNGDGNWLATLDAVAEAAARTPGVDVALCVPATLVHRAATRRPGLLVGGQDCHPAADGAHTGSVSAAMLHDAGARLVLVGHSERRATGDDDDAVAAKVAAALAAGLRPVVCVGESAAERASGDAAASVAAQLRRSLPADPGGDVAVAYEPVWAIGGHARPTPAEIGQVVGALRDVLRARGRENAAILYGGSVTADAVAGLIADTGVDGLLVGRASLAADSFATVLREACNVPSDKQDRLDRPIHLG